MKKREKELAKLSSRQQVAFAAICAERALAEGAKFAKEDLSKNTLLRKALDLAWRFAGGAAIDYGKAVKATHLEVARSVPDVDTPGADEVVTQVASAVARTLVVLEQPERAAAAAVSAANSALGLMSLVYEKTEEAERDEEAWQDKALKLIASSGEKVPDRAALSKIPDYERGPVYKVFRDRARKR